MCQTTDNNLNVRVKDLADIEGVRSNQLIGYGLVVGLKSHRRPRSAKYLRSTNFRKFARTEWEFPTDSAGLKPEKYCDGFSYGNDL